MNEFFLDVRKRTTTGQGRKGVQPRAARQKTKAEKNLELVIRRRQLLNMGQHG